MELRGQVWDSNKTAYKELWSMYKLIHEPEQFFACERRQLILQDSGALTEGDGPSTEVEGRLWILSDLVLLCVQEPPEVEQLQTFSDEEIALKFLDLAHDMGMTPQIAQKLKIHQKRQLMITSYDNRLKMSMENNRGRNPHRKWCVVLCDSVESANARYEPELHAVW